ncbi:hypothetical protein Fcan01_02623 [Folsomia candida]|uniref:Uncharacterized protein n=1 Tax=Folsomia candida TaxID=158441 RepID=A0A226EYW7_FOLCA|nr:hypothetical protein Fcan01_02623 [Folsomia candida]
MDNHNAANDLIKLNGYWINERFRDRHGSYMRVLSSLIIPTDLAAENDVIGGTLALQDIRRRDFLTLTGYQCPPDDVIFRRHCSYNSGKATQHGSRFARLLNSKHSNSNYHFFYLNKCFLIYGAIEITVQPRPFHRTAVLVLRQRLRTLEGLSSACQSAAPSTTSSFLLQVKAPKSSRF